MSDFLSEVKDFELRLNSFMTRWGQEKSSLLGLGSRVESLRGELSGLTAKVEENKEVLAKQEAEMETHRASLESGSKALANAKKDFEDLKAKELEALRLKNLEVENVKGEVQTRLDKLKKDEDALKAKHEALKGIIS